MDQGFWRNLPKPFFALAPMADVTDVAFRQIISECGKPDVLWTEFVSADGLMKAPTISKKEGEIAPREKLLADLKFNSDIERPVVAQLFSSNTEAMELAAKLCMEFGFDGIDINMGCPDRSIEKQGSGAAMIKTPEVAKEIIRAVKRGAPSLPISVKTRLGYNKDILKEWLVCLLEERPSAITIHARTRKEMSKVPARWERITDAIQIRDQWSKENKIPDDEKTLIVGNGDVRSLEDGLDKAKLSKADGVMVGRAVLGNPWFFAKNNSLRKFSPFFQSEEYAHKHGGKAFEKQSLQITEDLIEKRLDTLYRHVELFMKLLPHKSFATMKKHFKAYVSGWHGAKELRDKLMECRDGEEVLKIIKNK